MNLMGPLLISFTDDLLTRVWENSQKYTYKKTINNCFHDKSLLLNSW